MSTISKSRSLSRLSLISRFLTFLAVATYFFTIAPAWASALVSDPKFTALSTKNGLSQDTVNSMVYDDNGFLWLATEGGLNRFDGYRVTQVNGPANELTDMAIYALYYDSHGSLWISTADAGVYRYDLRSNEISAEVQIYFSGQNQWLQYASSFTEDSAGNVIIAMNESVLKYDYLQRKLTTVFSLSESEKDKNHSVRWATQYESILFVGFSGGLAGIDLETSKRVDIDYLQGVSANIDNVNVKFLLADSQSRFWIATVQGLYQMNLLELAAYVKNQHSLPRVHHHLEKRNVWRVLPQDSDYILVGTDLGLFKLDTSNKEEVFVLEPNNGSEELSRKDIQEIIFDKAGNLWFGTIYGGALYWSPTSLKFTSIYNSRFADQYKPLSHNTIWSFYQSEPNKLWVGTDNGLNHLDLKTFKSDKFLVSPEGMFAFSDSTIERILPAQHNRLWLQTALGLRLFDILTGQLIDIPYASEQAKLVFEQPVYGAVLDARGRVWFTNNANFFEFDPSSGSLSVVDFKHPDINPKLGAEFLGALSHVPNSMFLGLPNGLWLVDTETHDAKLIHEFPTDENPQNIAPSSWLIDDNNVLWVAYPSVGLVGLDANTFEQLYVFNKDNLLTTNIVYGLQKDSSNAIWFSSHSGIHRFNSSLNQLTHFRYGQELSTSEFNQGASYRLRDGSLVYGSPKGITLFDPKEIGTKNAYGDQLAITEVDLSSRELNLPLSNLSGKHITLQYDDVGLTINFSNMAFDLSETEVYQYQLTSNNNLVARASTRVPKVTFPTLDPGVYEFKVTMPRATSIQSAPLAMLTITVNYAPWASPLAILGYIVFITLMLLGLFKVRKKLRESLERERAKVRLFGTAFKHTRDWVLIFDANRKPVATNAAFDDVFEFDTGKEVQPQLTSLLYRQPEFKELIEQSFEAVHANGFSSQEFQISIRHGHNRDVLINTTAVFNKSIPTRIDYYMFVFTDISEQKHAERQLVKVANYDSLTGLVNRSLFLDRLEHAIVRAKHHAVRHAVLFIDLDRFKSVNDSLGHEYGDKLLQNVAKRMLGIATENDTVARLGGDEFVILVEDMERPDHLIDFINRLIETVETPITVQSEVLRISCSIGVSLFPDDATEPQELLKQADVAMYSAKGDNLTGFKFYTEELNMRAKQRLLLENQIKTAFQEKLFENHYQPIVDIQQGKAVGFELLLRCKVDDQMISPYLFIPVAEELRLIIEITQDALVRGLNDLREWYDQGFAGYLSVNLSALHFKSTFDVEQVVALLEKHDLPVGSLRFEITESALMENTEAALDKFSSLRKAGFQLALDDFGTGYSSLSYLKKFPLQVLKIDKSFVDDIGKDDDSDAIVLTTLGMAKNLNMTCVAEGIESKQQVSFFFEHGCRYIQGYYFSKPVAKQAIEDLLSKQWPTEY